MEPEEKRQAKNIHPCAAIRNGGNRQGEVGIEVFAEKRLKSIERPVSATVRVTAHKEVRVAAAHGRRIDDERTTVGATVVIEPDPFKDQTNGDMVGQDNRAGIVSERQKGALIAVYDLFLPLK